MGQTSAPTQVTRGGTAQVVIDYEATDSRQIGIWLHDSTDNWRTVGQALEVVPSGVGQRNFDISILNDARIGSGYVWALRLLPTD